MSYRREVRLLLFLGTFLSLTMFTRWWFWLGPGQASIAWASALPTSVSSNEATGDTSSVTPVPEKPSIPTADTTGNDTSKTSANPGNCVDVNAATQEQLESLPGIGPVLAKAILAARTALGGFQSTDALLDVKGIGPARLGKIRPFLCPSPSEKAE